MGDQVPAGSARRAVVLIEDGFDHREVEEILGSLRAAGVEVELAGMAAGTTFKDRNGDATCTADVAVRSVRLRDIDAVVIPGGYAPDRMRLRHVMVDLAGDALRDGTKIVAAIGHGPQLLISANVLQNRTLTCWPSIAVDVMNAGGLYVDKPVAEDGNLVTSRKPDDVPAFCEAILRGLARVARPKAKPCPDK